MRRKGFFFLLCFSYVISIVITCVYNDYSISPLMPITSIFFGLGYAFIKHRRKRAFHSISVNIIFLMYFIRMVIFPAVYICCGYTSNVQTSAGTDNLTLASLLVCWEYFCVLLFILASKRISEIDYIIGRKDQQAEISENHSMSNIMVLIIVGLLGIAALCIISNRSVLLSISTVFRAFISDSDERIARVIARRGARSGISSITYHLFMQSVFYLQILIPASLISYITNKRRQLYQYNEKYINWGFVWCLLISASSVVVNTSSNSNSVVIMAACFLVTFDCYKNKKKRYLSLVIILVGAFSFAFLLAKTGVFSREYTDRAYISKLLGAYFSGLPNISAGFAVQYESKLRTFFGDIVSGVPFLVYFIPGLPTSVQLFNTVIYGYSGRVNQIMPLVSYGYQYLFIFAPIFPVAFYSFALWAEKRYRDSSIAFNKVIYALVMVSMSLGPSLYGLPSLITRTCYYVILLAVIVGINNKKVTVRKH